MIQKTEEWQQARWGKFTGSQIWKLMSSGRKKDELFGQTAIGYIREKVAEIITEGRSQDHKQVDTWATKWGNTYEPEAKRIYQEFTFNKVTDCAFILFNDFFGASPDGLIGRDGVLEIKCPYLSENHVDFLLCQTPQDLFETEPKYYYQMQAEILATGRKWAEFVSYDPLANERHCLKILRIPKDEQICAEILLRVKKAAEILTSILQKL